MELLNQFIRIINIFTNTLGGILFAPIAMVPGWLSITIISAIFGVLLLSVFKSTSNQEAITHIRDDVKANLLAIKLFKDSTFATFNSQIKLLSGSLKLLFYSVIPMMIMIIPVSLILVQLGLWYQFRPITAGDEYIIVKLELNEKSETFPQVILESNPAAEIAAGPVRILSRKEVYWKIKPLENGNHYLTFMVGDLQLNKSLAVGNHLMRLNPKRPGHDFMDRLLYPLEKPFEKDSIVQSISVEYPERNSRVYGTDCWVLSLFIISMISALIFKPLLNVRL